MISTIFWVIVGMFIGWAFPQPAWIKSLADNVVTKVKSIFGS